MTICPKSTIATFYILYSTIIDIVFFFLLNDSFLVMPLSHQRLSLLLCHCLMSGSRLLLCSHLQSASAFASCCASLSMLPSCSLDFVAAASCHATTSPHAPLVLCLLLRCCLLPLAACREYLLSSGWLSHHHLSNHHRLLPCSSCTSHKIILFCLAFQQHHQPESPPWCH